MPRHFWISASIAVLVAAFALFALALPALYRIDAAELSARPDQAALQVQAFTVPPARAEAIRIAVNTVLLATPGRDGVQPLGQASLPAPDRLVVSAPARMQDSIRRAIVSLSEGETAAPEERTAIALDVWLVEAVDARQQDPRLAIVEDVLNEARQRFGHAQYRLLERSMVTASPGRDSVMVRGARSSANFQTITRRPGGQIEAKLEFRMGDNSGNWILSQMLLPDGQWQLVGLLPRTAANAPESLLLVRQTPSMAAAAGK